MLIIIGFLVMLVMYTAVSVLSGAGAMLFLDFPSLLIIVIPLLFFMLVSGSGKIIGRYWSSSFKKDYNYTREELAGIYGAAKGIIRFILSMGGFGFLVGIIASLAYLGSTEHLGPNLAISLLTVLYAITISFFMFFPVQAWAGNRLHFSRESGDSRTC